ncbi:SCO family protein [Desertivirga xinjiangensis]|uniref:SCO family protein n=1 Tax=Desertivirga xinjiangensis TaxID=539206 RepID=UPI002109D47D|nr:SCO family protein [Pedobacter xinjiangensis]
MKKIIACLLTLAFVAIYSCSGNKVDVGKEPGPALPPESVYNLETTWEDQNGDSLQLKELRGKIPVMSMIFTRCAFACPRIIADMKAVASQVPGDKKDKVVFVLVSFDSDHDNAARLKQFASQMQLDDQWVLLHGDPEQVRELSMILNIKYKKQPDGSFSHSNVLSVLGPDGVIEGQSEGLGVNPEMLTSKIEDL